LYGGNSNWRGPVWVPVNQLLIDALRRYGDFFGDDFLVDYPHGSGRPVALAAVADDLTSRLVALFLPDADGHRPSDGDVEPFRGHPRWRDQVTFYEYFDGDNGKGLGASHQTGWTGLVAHLLMGRGG
jgi:hypothetical protein